MSISYEIFNVTVRDSSFGDHRKTIETVLELERDEIYVGRMQVLETFGDL